jgi:hypothetical protein
LSVGAGSAYVEGVLSKIHGFNVTVVDFPEVIALNKVSYDEREIIAVAGDATKAEELELGRQKFDLLLTSELMEHIPQSPQMQIQGLLQFLNREAVIVIGTPNAGSLKNLAVALKMKPHLPSAQRVFGEVSFANEGVHRREYYPCEIIEALGEVGFKVKSIDFCGKPVKGSLFRRFSYRLLYLVPRFRDIMIVVAQRASLG